QKETTPNPALVLTLNIKNTSGSREIYPMDPAFTRKANPGKGDEPITRLVVNKQAQLYFAGGYLEWPNTAANIIRKYEEKQASDNRPLKPGETRQYVVYTEPKLNVIDAAKTAKDTMQWRVEVRRGLIEFRGKEIPVTAIIGVDFRASEITG